ncbi:MAG: hypothetical protein AB1467_00765 [Candidatus Diapherotrites archaeon]
MNKFGLTKDVVFKVIQETSQAMKKFRQEYLDKYGVNVSNKLLSELLSKIMEAKAEDIFTKAVGYEIKKETKDSEPDLFFTKIKTPLEIKTTSTLTAWTGGEFSKRPFDYLLVSWGGNFDEFFVALVKLKKADWKSNFSKNFYGPSYSAQKLFKRKDKEVFLGSFEKTSRGAIKIVREKV